MNVNFDDILRSAETTFPRGDRQRRTRGKRCPVCDDGVLLDTRDRLCLTCGEELVDNLGADDVLSETRRFPMEPINIFDLLSEDLRREIQNSLALSLPDKQISTEYLSKLGKVVLDSRRGLLYDVTLSIGPLSIMCVLASFGPIPADELTTNMILGDPEFGETSDLSNSVACSGSIVVLKRGKVSFAQKAITAKKSGAAALIVCQTFDIWPFVMTDSANEISDIGLDIPVMMVSDADSLLLSKLLNSRTLSGSGEAMNPNQTSSESMLRKSIHTKLLCGRFEEECSICQELMLKGNTVLKLLCRHAYHARCVQVWLERHNTCPLCRNEMPLHIGPKKRQSSSNDAAPQEMPYFN